MLQDNKGEKTFSDVIFNSKGLRKGMLREIGATEFAVLAVIASFGNELDESIVSQRKIAEVTGLSLPTVNKVVKRLMEKRLMVELF